MALEFTFVPFGPSGGGGEDLAATLLLGNTTGATDIVVDTAVAIRGADAATAGGLTLRGGNSSAAIGGAFAALGGIGGPGATAYNGGTVAFLGGATNAANTNVASRGGDVVLMGGSPAGAALLAGGMGNTVLGDGGSASILGGPANAVAEGDGGPISLIGGAAYGPAKAGGDVLITAGPSAVAGGTSPGGGVFISAGGGNLDPGGTGGTGGDLVFSAGTCGQDLPPFTPGSIILRAASIGTATSSETRFTVSNDGKIYLGNGVLDAAPVAAAEVTATGGLASATGTAIVMQGGESGPAGGWGGDVSILGGKVNTANTIGVGGTVNLTAGDSVGPNQGGSIMIRSGVGGPTGSGGVISLLASDGGAGGGNGGDVQVFGGDALAGSDDGGQVYITGGDGASGGKGGYTHLRGGDGGFGANGGVIYIEAGAGGGGGGSNGTIIFGNGHPCEMYIGSPSATSKIGFFGAFPVHQGAAYTRNATVVEDRVLLASASATATNNNNVLAALVADLQALGLIG